MTRRLPIAPEPRRWAVDCCTLPARRRICEDYGCRYHLGSDDDTRGRRRRTLEERRRHVAVLPVTCALDVAHARATTVNAVALLLGLSRHAVELIEERARVKLRMGLDGGAGD